MASLTSGSIFHWARIQTEGRNFQALAAALGDSTIPALQAAGGQPWVIANGLFGLWTNELILVNAWPNDGAASSAVAANLPPGASIVQQYEFVATARPATDEPPTRPGLYVHRLFEVHAADVERFVELSREAWTTFEGSGDYQAEPQGLFRQREHPAEGGLMCSSHGTTLRIVGRSRTPSPRPRRTFAPGGAQRKSMALPTRPLVRRSAERHGRASQREISILRAQHATREAHARTLIPRKRQMVGERLSEPLSPPSPRRSAALALAPAT